MDSLEGEFAELMLEMPQQRTCSGLLDLIVRRLNQRAGTALARIWLALPGDICDACHLASECRDRTTCMHLEASAGKSLVDASADWSATDGAFRRFPMGVRKVGKIAATRQPVEVPNITGNESWIARPEWVKAEGIRGFGGQPLLFKGEVLGVLAVFTREPLKPHALVGLRMIADHAAIAIANARAFEQIDELRAKLELENTYLREEVREASMFGEIVGQSPALRHVIEQMDLVATTSATVLITGESGTGKELVAREIHDRSGRRDCPMIKVNCASVPRELYESEFFGHVKGAFTGAVQDRVGRFAAADGGTLFLDEVGEIPLELQSKLLRVLQEGEYERVGDERTQQVDVRIVAATNRNLKAEVEAGRFRQDLYYRLNVFPLLAVPLRDRRDDIPLLAEHFLKKAARGMNRPIPKLTKAGVAQLQSYQWPGNVRELQNVIERSVITSTGRSLRFDLPTEPEVERGEDGAKEVRVIATDAEMKRRERSNLTAALEETRWKISGAGGAAELLGIRATTLTSRLKKLGIERGL
ncbi:MAG: transcriptional regulator with GAF, ATPase, and Fis domain [Neolewinella sp.]|jgi:transcriptional regulator with GAF, ATPase, and Fis domain